MSSTEQTPYSASGVDADAAESALARLARNVRSTWPAAGQPGAVALDLGYYANVIDVGGGLGIAFTTDGVGSKVLVAEMMGRFDTIGIDCVAMNVNDLLCVGARPLSLVDYLAVEVADPDLIEQVSVGLRDGALLAGVSIPGGEIAQLPDIIRGTTPGRGFDLAASAIGTVALDRIVVGQHAEPGDVLVGIESSGIHSNGLSLARQVLLEQGKLQLDEAAPGLDGSVGAELLRPTALYVREILEVFDRDVHVKALFHVTGDGFLNLRRVQAPVGWRIDYLPPVSPLFSLIQRLGALDDAEMYRVFNMGVGFALAVPEAEVDAVIAIVEGHGKRAFRLGTAISSADHEIRLEPLRLVSRNGRFVPA